MRVVAVAEPDPGHLLPVAALAAALAARGHQVTVLTGDRWAGDLSRAGLAFLPLPPVAADRDGGGLGWLLHERTASMATPLAELLSAEPPDVVLADTLTRAGGLAADLLNRPWVELVPHFLWWPSRSLPPVGLGMAPPRTPLGHLHAAHLRRLQGRSWRDGLDEQCRARAGLGLLHGGSPQLRLVATLPGLEPPRSDWPEHTFVVGALEWEPDWPALPLPAGEGPLVLVAASTATGAETPGRSLAAATLAELAPRGLRGVVTTPVDLGPPPPGWVVGEGSHARVLEHAAVVVAHGGHGLVGKALVRGIPLVLAPLHGDQLETAGRVRCSGAGVSLRLPLAGGALADAVGRVLTNPSYAAAARRLAAGAQGLGAARAAQLVERRVRVTR